MRILLIGKTYAAAAFAQYFTQNPDNIVFSTLENTDAEFIDILPDNIRELKDFALANEMSVTLLCDSESLLSPIKEEFGKDGLKVFAPDNKIIKQFDSRIWTKKFIYKNKIPTARFQFFEKQQAAADSARKGKFPLVVKPDCATASRALICETFGCAKHAIEAFFDSGFKKVLTEEYIWGKEFSIYTICGGYDISILCGISKYQNSFAMLGTDFLSEKDKQNALDEIILPFFDSLTRETGQYCGILGYNFIKTKDKIYLVGVEPFFKDIDAQIAVNCTAERWENLIESAISASLTENFVQIQQNNSHILACEFYENGKKINISSSAKTFNAARRMLIDDGADAKEIEEALRFWKY